MQKYSMNEKIAAALGYKIICGEIINPKGKPLNGHKTRNGYMRFTVRKIGERKPIRCSVHRLVAYQKFGDKIYQEGVVVRHLDGDSLNNNEENIEIGSHHDNMMDIPKEERRARALNASLKSVDKTRRFSYEEISDIRVFHKKHQSYRRTMVEFSISSKGSLHHILNNPYL